jgi:hypothetical protein
MSSIQIIYCGCLIIGILAFIYVDITRDDRNGPTGAAA